MKILLDHHQPFRLAHGGLQMQIERTRAALAARGVEVEPLRWWDAEQRGDLIHFYGVPSPGYLHQAKLRRVPVILTPILSETCNRPRWRLAAQGFLQRLLLALPGGEGVKQQLNWRSFRAAAHHVVGLEAERQVLQVVHRVPAAAISVVPLGVTDAFLNAGPGGRAGDHLICPGTITDAKNPVLLAETARAAQVPVLFVGRAFAETDPCWQRFQRLVDGRCVRHHPHVDGEAEMVTLLHGARGFVLASRYENWSLAAHEAAACGLPLLLPDQPWSRERFGAKARYWQPGDAAALRRFHEECVRLPAPRVKLFSWADVAAQLQSVYEAVLRNSR